MIPLRDDTPRFSTPYVTYFLIAINTLVFLYELSLGQRTLNELVYVFGVVPTRVEALMHGVEGANPGVALVPILTSMFLHASWLHLIGNMWVLYIFGDNIEDYLGHFKYLVFYLLAGLIAMATQVAIYPHSNIPTVGASGAIAGVLGAYFILYPRARVLTAFFLFTLVVPIW